MQVGLESQVKFWPTPKTVTGGASPSDHERIGSGGGICSPPRNSSGRWPSPTAHDGRRPGADLSSTQGANLNRDAANWSTPQAHDAGGGEITRTGQSNERTVRGWGEESSGGCIDMGNADEPGLEGRIMSGSGCTGERSVGPTVGELGRERVGWWHCEEHGSYEAFEYRGDEKYLRADGDWMLMPGQCPECGSGGDTITYDAEHGGTGKMAEPSSEGLPISDRKRTRTTGECHAESQRGRGRSIPLFALGPGATEVWQDLLVRHHELRPAISQAEVESLVCDLDDGLAAVLDGSRTDQLRACGNGIVPLQFAAAFRILARRMGY